MLNIGEVGSVSKFLVTPFKDDTILNLFRTY